MQQVVLPEEDVLQYFDVDTRSLWAEPPDGFRPRDLGPYFYEDEWNVVRHCPPGGHYFDLHKCPLADDPTVDDLERFPWPDPDDPGRVRGLRERAEYLRQKTDYAVVLNLGATLLHTSQYLRGFEGWFMDVALRPEFMHALLDQILDVHLRTIRNVLGAAGGENIDVAFIADDLTTDTGPMFSPAAYREFLKPRLKQIIGAIRELSGAKILYHCCGAVHHFLDDLIECGVDAINPVQTSAHGMEPAKLKAHFGARVSFWGGIDTRRVLNHGTTEEVRAEVRRVVRALAPGGGYVLNFVHNAQPDVKPENIVAMVAALRECETC
jgi:uroporphyrinogen decarboxylase